MEELREAHEAAERALCAASSEGLALVRANNASGFKGVMRDARKSKSFQARLNRGGKLECLGSFATPEEAALAYARALGPEGSKATAKDAKPAIAADAANVAAASEGLALVRADTETVARRARLRRRRPT